MIRTFNYRDTQKLFNGSFIKKLPTDIQRVALRKLKILDAATMLDTLKVPPGNRLEALKGNRVGQYSIRINDLGEFVFPGIKVMLLRLKLLIIIKVHYD